MKYFKNFTVFVSSCTLIRVTFFLYVKHYLSFIYGYCSSLILSAGLLAWFACLSTGSKVRAVERLLWRASHTVQPSGGHRSEGRQCLKYGHPYTTLALANQCLGCCWKDGCCWTSEQRTTSIKIHPIQTKTKQIGRCTVLVVFNRFYYKCTSKESIIGICQ